jgi:hypothetical protein
MRITAFRLDGGGTAEECSGEIFFQNRMMRVSERMDYVVAFAWVGLSCIEKTFGVSCLCNPATLEGQVLVWVDEEQSTRALSHHHITRT